MSLLRSIRADMMKNRKISRVIQEVGASGSTIVSGTVSGYEGYYNFYNIGATASGGDKNQTIINGLKYAKNEGWDSPYKAIVGGASFLGNNYVAAGKKTEYLQITSGKNREDML